MLHNGYNYNPYLHSSYHNPLQYAPNAYGGYQRYQPTYEDLARERERAEALAARRARRAQYLPDEDVIDSEEEELFGPLSQRERMYLAARREQEALERAESERRKAAEQQQRQRASPGRENQHSSIPEQHVPSHRRKSSQASANRRSIPVQVPDAQPEAPSPSTTPPQPSPPVQPAVVYTQEHHDAAERIQKRYRQRQALKAVNEVAAQFEEAKKNFVLPDALDYVNPERPDQVITIPLPPTTLQEGQTDVKMEDVDGAVSSTEQTEKRDIDSSPATPSSSASDRDVSVTPPEDKIKVDLGNISGGDAFVPRLEYTKRNYPLHAYMEKLNVLLMKLDSVQSYGSKKVRQRRKEVARMIEEEAARIERTWKDAWERYWKERAGAPSS